jgi:alpha-N-arabinofuranosidase
MDQFDPRKRVSLVVDEWGAWYNVEPGTNPGFLYQQNTLRDAILAGIILHVFHKHAERVQIANIAQMVNVLQAIILTDEDKMVLTPTYHIFDMYKVHQDATLLPMTVNAGEYGRGRRTLPRVSTTASLAKDGTINISFVNIDPNNEVEMKCDVRGTKQSQITGAKVITADKIDSHNTFEKPEEVVLADLKGAVLCDGVLSLKLPAKSVVTVQIR